MILRLTPRLTGTGFHEMLSLLEFVEELRKKGYSVEFNAKIKGESGHVHEVDGLAELVEKHRKRLILWLDERKDSLAEIIAAFAIAYDTGAEPCYAIGREPSEEARKLADTYKLRLLAKEKGL